MMELLRNWLTGVTAAAILCALADSLMPEGPVRRVGRLTCGLVMLAAVLSPFLRLEALPAPELRLEDAGEQVQDLEQARNSALKPVIEQALSAYAADKAAELGAPCSVRISCQPGENGVLLPCEAVLQGSFTPEQREAAAQFLQSELGIPRDRQTILNQREEETP